MSLPKTEEMRMEPSEIFKTILGLIAGVAFFGFVGFLAVDKSFKSESEIASAALFTVGLIAIIFCSLSIFALLAVIFIAAAGGVIG